MPVWAQAGLWGGVAGSALVLGAVVGFYVRLPRIAVASIMAFGVGVLVSALSFNLMEEAVAAGGLWPASAGFIFGALFYAGANALLSARGAAHRKRSSMARRPKAGDTAAIAIALGALLDGVPESAAIGASLVEGESVALVTVFAIFISNVPEGLSSAAGMRQSGHGPVYVFGVWIAIAVASVAAAWFGYAVLGQLGGVWLAAAVASAAGAILVMIIQTMIPEAFENVHGWTGAIAALGFLVAFVASGMM